MKKLILTLSISIATFCQAFADEDSNFTIVGDKVIYSTESDIGDIEIRSDHVDEFLALLKANSNLKLLELNSGGGSVWAAQEMSRIALDFELDTTVVGKCSSSCTIIFLAGNIRTLERGSKIGFHSRTWSVPAMKRYYNKWKEDEEWEDEFDFVAWVYADTRSELYDDINFAIQRGVTPKFAVEMHAPRKDMWYPPRSALLEGGILRG